MECVLRSVTGAPEGRRSDAMEKVIKSCNRVACQEHETTFDEMIKSQDRSSKLRRLLKG